MSEHICKQCGKSFGAPPSDNALYCSQACYWESKRKRIKRVCQNCGKEFEALPAEVHRHGGKYCSRECWRAHNHGDGNPSWKGGDICLTCTTCGKEFTRPRTWPRESFEGNVFCSQGCRTEWMRENPEEHPRWEGGKAQEQYGIRKSWKYTDWRRAVFERDDYTCQGCGQRGGRLNAHHIKPFSTHPELRLDLSNGQTLCKKCHEQVHIKPT